MLSISYLFVISSDMDKDVLLENVLTELDQGINGTALGGEYLLDLAIDGEDIDSLLNNLNPLSDERDNYRSNNTSDAIRTSFLHSVETEARPIFNINFVQQ